MKMTTEIMLARFKAAHGARYDYSQAVYTYGHNPVTVICRVHGLFAVSMYNHASGHGCNKCASVARGIKSRVSNKHRVELLLSRLPGPDKYDFAELLASAYTGGYNLPITCKLHGRVTAHYSNLLSGKGCPACGALTRGYYAKSYNVAPQVAVAQGRITKHAPIFIEKARVIHSGFYDYSQVVYRGMRSKVDIVCPDHGVFSQTPMKHISQAQGCPRCSNRISKGETGIAVYLAQLGVSVETSNRTMLRQEQAPNSTRKALMLELDVYLPDLKVGIEYNGAYWHADDLGRTGTMLRKWELANKAGIRLIQLFDDEWLQRRTAVEGLLRSAARQAGSIGARNLVVRSIHPAGARAFLDAHHLQGFLGAKTHYGLYKGDELFAVASFGASRFEADTVELIRYASVCNIAGGLSKIIKHTGLAKLTSYCDMRHGTGQAYLSAGFISEGLTPPDYWWFKGDKRYARYECQKHRLKAHPDFTKFYDDAKTERQICEEAGFRKISGVGHLKFVFTTK